MTKRSCKWHANCRVKQFRETRWPREVYAIIFSTLPGPRCANKECSLWCFSFWWKHRQLEQIAYFIYSSIEITQVLCFLRFILPASLVNFQAKDYSFLILYDSGNFLAIYVLFIRKNLFDDQLSKITTYRSSENVFLLLSFSRSHLSDVHALCHITILCHSMKVYLQHHSLKRIEIYFIVYFKFRDSFVKFLCLETNRDVSLRRILLLATQHFQSSGGQQREYLSMSWLTVSQTLMLPGL